MGDLSQSAVEAASAVATKTSVTAYTTGWSTTIYGFLSQVDWMQLLGALILIGTFLVNWYYKHQHLKLEEIKVKHRLGDLDNHESEEQ